MHLLESDKMLFHPVYFHEIPVELRTPFLESLSAYKDQTLIAPLQGTRL